MPINRVKYNFLSKSAGNKTPGMPSVSAPEGNRRGESFEMRDLKAKGETLEVSHPKLEEINQEMVVELPNSPPPTYSQVELRMKEVEGAPSYITVPIPADINTQDGVFSNLAAKPEIMILPPPQEQDNPPVTLGGTRSMLIAGSYRLTIPKTSIIDFSQPVLFTAIPGFRNGMRL